MGRLKVAIIGSGPSGYYAAEALQKQKGDEVQIDIIDRLPTPYGLIRTGVAPDHQSIKMVYRRYEETQTSGDTKFFGNIEIGDSVTIAELQSIYDAIIIATGASQDRKLGVPGEDLPGVIGAGAFVGWYNSHPDFAKLEPDLNTARVVVVGNGNVAIDVARVLVKTPDEMAQSDLAGHAAEIIQAAPIREVVIAGRRGPHQVSFTTKELGELGELHQAVALVDPAQLPDAETDAALDPGQRKVVGHLRTFAANTADAKPRAVRFAFFLKPLQILGDRKVEGVRFERTRLDGDKAVGTGELVDIPCGLVVACIGYRTVKIPGVPYDHETGRFPNTDGLIEPGLYCVGWARRGPTGTIGTNRNDSAAVITLLLSQCSPSDKPGRAALEKIIADRDLWAVRFDGWKKIEQAEAAAAQGTSPRQKFAHVDHMLDVALKSD